MTDLNEFDKNRSHEELVMLRQMDRELVSELKEALEWCVDILQEKADEDVNFHGMAPDKELLESLAEIRDLIGGETDEDHD